MKDVAKGTEVTKETFLPSGLYLISIESLIKGILPDYYKI